VTIDFSQVEALADKLDLDAQEILKKTKPVVSKGALNVKNGMRIDAADGGHYKHFNRSITYDINDDGLTAEIGPDKALIQGALGNILYFGTSKNAPVIHLEGPLNKETPRLERVLGDVAEDIL
jgi:hypothetical protein